jgi:Protein of unknown function (DUF3467)
MGEACQLVFALLPAADRRGCGAEGLCGSVAERKQLPLTRPRVEVTVDEAAKQQVQIKADEKEMLGQYSNLVMIHHNAEEFTMQFIYIFPNAAQGKLVASLILSPGHAKRLWRALGENIARYETQFSPIREAPEPTPTPSVGFVQ